jgi:hypothetical protein
MSNKNDYLIYDVKTDSVIQLESVLTERPFILDFNMPYFYSTLQAAVQVLDTKGLTFYITRSIDYLPSYGNNVVVICLGDEHSCIPNYTPRVKAVFKTYGCSAFLPRLASGSVILDSLTFLNYLRIIIKKMPYWFRYYINLNKQFYKNTCILPLGYYQQLAVPFIPFEQRIHDMYFAGSIEQGSYSVFSLKRWLPSPKTLSRNRLIASLKYIKQEYPAVKLSLKLLGGFQTETLASSTDDYSSVMMNTKIICCPRGTHFETFRVFEAFRFGCIVISEPLPNNWYYKNAPIITITDWSKLPKLITTLLSDRKELQRLHEEALNYWDLVLSEKAVGLKIGTYLKESYSK